MIIISYHVLGAIHIRYDDAENELKDTTDRHHQEHTMTPPTAQGRPRVPDAEQLSYPAGQALAALTMELRPDWHHAGILKALQKLVTTHTAVDLATALIQATQHTDAKTPAAIHYPGPWWNHTQPTTTNTPNNTTPRPDRPTPCPITAHARIGKYQHNCPECRLLQDFPHQLDKHTYDQLAPEVQLIVDRNPNVVVLT